MATNRWLDVNGTPTDVANWSLAHVPAAAEDIICDAGNKAIAGVDWSAINPASFKLGAKFTGTWGTSTVPLKFGTITTFTYDGQLCPSFNISASPTTAVIYSTHTAPDSFYATAGTWAKALVLGGSAVRFGGSVTLTKLITAALGADNIYVTLDSGLTLTAADIQAGNILASCAAGTIDQSGGRWQHIGSSTNNITALNIWRAGRFEFKSMSAVITKVVARAGAIFDGASDDTIRTITDMDAYPGAEVVLDDAIICTNNPVDYGAGIRGIQTITRIAIPGGTGGLGA